MSRIFLLLVVSIAVISCSSNVSDSNAQQELYPQQYSTSGNTIVDASANEAIFRGVSIESPILLSHSTQDSSTNGIYYFDQYLSWNEGIFRTISQWGANIVRLPVEPAAWRVHGKTDCLQILDEAIAWAAKYKLYVILDFHSVGYPATGEYESNIAGSYGELFITTPAEILNFWGVVSEHYKNNMTVAFYEVFNEAVYPSFLTANYQQSTQTWLSWKTFTEEIIDTIRVHDPSSSVIVGGLLWSYDLSYISQSSTNAINRENVIYSVHPYPGARVMVDSSVADWDTVFGGLSANYPIFATELGFLLDDPSSLPYYEGLFVGNGLYRDAIRRYVIEKRISWTAWCFSPYVWPKLLQDKNYTPTVAGSFMQQWMQQYPEVMLQ